MYDYLGGFTTTCAADNFADDTHHQSACFSRDFLLHQLLLDYVKSFSDGKCIIISKSQDVTRWKAISITFSKHLL